MDKQIMLMDLATRYHAKAFTKNYIMVYNVKGVVYFTVCTSELVDHVVCLDKASRGQGYSLRFKPNAEQKRILMAHGCKVLCSAKFFEEQVAESKYNRGEIAEKLVTEYVGQTWTKDNVPFTDAGDIEINGIAYQIKYEKATFTNEKSLASLEK